MADSQVTISASVVHVDTRTTSKIIVLPPVSSVLGRSITIRDAFGSCSTNNIYIKTTGDDFIDFFTISTLALSNSFESVRFIAYSTSWAVVQDYTQIYRVKNRQWLIGTGGPNSVSSLFYSGDGTNWSISTAKQTVFDGAINTIANNSNLWILGGNDTNPNNKYLKYSYDTFTWSNDPGIINFVNAAYGITYNKNQDTWVATGGSETAPGSILYSRNPTQGWSTSILNGFAQGEGYNVDTNGSNLYIAVGNSVDAGGTILSSSNASSWADSINGGFSTSGVYQANGIAYNGIIWVAAGTGAYDNDSLKFSYDGLNWFNSATGGFFCYSQIPSSVFVASALGDRPEGTLLYSGDGSNWSNAWTGGFNYLSNGRYTGNSVIWSSTLNTFYATGTAVSMVSSLLYSTDGSNWVAPLTGGFAGPKPDKFTGEGIFNLSTVWTAVGYNLSSPQGTILYSLDGVNWSDANSGGFTGSIIEDGYSSFVGKAVIGTYTPTGNLWVATGKSESTINNTILYTRDGSNWSNAITGGFLPVSTNQCVTNGITFGSSIWMAVGSNCPTPTGTICHSRDGMYWVSSFSGGFPSTGYCVSFGYDKWVAAGAGSNRQGSLLYSVDGVNWNPAASGGFDDGQGKYIAYSVAYEGFQGGIPGGKWVAAGVGSNGRTSLQYSLDGINWNNIVSGGFPTTGTSVAFGSSIFYSTTLVYMTCGRGTISSGTIQMSLDGFNFNNISTGGFGGFGASTNIFQANKIIGIGLTPLNQTLGGRWTAVGYSGTPEGTIQYSDDGLNWSNVPRGGFSSVGYNLAYTGWGTFPFMACGLSSNSRSTIQFSSDGVNWAPTPLVPGSTFAADVGGRFVYKCNVVAQGDTTNFAGGFATSHPSSTVITWGQGGGAYVPYSTWGFTKNECFGIATQNNGGGENNVVFVGASLDGQGTILDRRMSSITWGGFDDGKGNYIGYDISNRVGIGSATNDSYYVAVGLGTYPTSTIMRGSTISNRSGVSTFVPAVSGGFSSLVGYGVKYEPAQGRWYAFGASDINTSNVSTVLVSIDNGFNWRRISSGGYFMPIQANFDSHMGIGHACGTAAYGVGMFFASTPRLWFATGYANNQTSSIQYSEDAINWKTPLRGGFQSGRGRTVTTNNSTLWVFGGEDTNGLNQILNISSPFLASSNSYAFGTNRSTVGFQGGYVQSFSFGSTISGISMWSAVGNSFVNSTASLLYSFDGLRWSTISTGGFTKFVGNAVENNGSNLWIAGGMGGNQSETLLASSNLYNWSTIINGPFYNPYSSIVHSSLTIIRGHGLAVSSQNLWIAAGEGVDPFTTLLYSRDGSNWSRANSGGFSNTRNVIFRANGVGIGFDAARSTIFIATGEGDYLQDSIKYSQDGSNWSNVIFGGFDNNDGTYIGNSVTYTSNNYNNNGYWVASGIGSNDRTSLIYSYNGLYWLSSVTGGSYFRTATSATFKTIGSQTSSISTLAEIWVATGYGSSSTNSILYSLDNGRNWSNIQSGGFGSSDNNSFVGWGVGAGNNTWVAVGSNATSTGTIQVSKNGSNWQTANGNFTRTAGGLLAGYSVSYLAATNTWVAVGTSSNSTGNILYSYDGFNWNNANNSFIGNTYLDPSPFVGYTVTNDGRSLWVAGGKGLAPSSFLYNSFTPFFGVEAIKYSYDGINWSNPIQGFGVVSNAQYIGTHVNQVSTNLWVATGYSEVPYTTIRTSFVNPDPTNKNGLSNWNAVASGGFSTFGTGVVFNSTINLAIATGNADSKTQAIQYSRNFCNWFPAVTGGFSNTFLKRATANGVAFDGYSTFVAAGIGDGIRSTTSLQYSTDGSNWRDIESGGFASTATAVIASGSILQSTTRLFVATGNGIFSTGSLLYSADGKNWSTSVSGGFGYSNNIHLGNAVTFNPSTGTWAAAGFGNQSVGTLLYSLHGSNWSNSINGGFSTVAYNVGIGRGILPNNFYQFTAVGGSGGLNTILYSRDANTWRAINRGGFNLQGDGISFNPSTNTWVAVGSANNGQRSSIQYSFDGSNFFAALTGGFRNSFNNFFRGRGVANNGSNLWVATGFSWNARSTLMYSSNALNWDAVQSGGFGGTVTEGYGIAFGRNMWVAAGNGNGVGSLQYSLNGLRFSNGDTNQFAIGTAIAYNQYYGGTDLWVATGRSAFNTRRGTILYSLNGSNWDIIATGGFFDGGSIYRGNGVAFNGSNLWVAVGKSSNAVGTIQYSGDAINWSNAASGGFNNGAGTFEGLGVTFNSNIWVAVGSGSNTSTSILYSTDGSNWNITPNNPSGTSNYVNVSFANLFLLNSNTITVAVGNGGSSTTSIQYTNDGSNWSSIQTGGFIDNDGNCIGRGIGFASSLGWVAAGKSSKSTGTLLYSSNALNWSNAISGGFTGLEGYNVSAGLSSTREMLVAAGSALKSSGTLLYSFDGLRWNAANSGGFSTVAYDVAYNGSNLWVAAGLSPNALNTLQYSGDGSNWSNALTGGFTTGVAKSIRYFENRWIATGTTSAVSTISTTIQYSLDGCNWSLSESGGFVYEGNGIGYGNGRFVSSGIVWVATGYADGPLGTIQYSTDGLNWSNINTGGFRSGGGNAIAHNWSGSFVATGTGTLSTTIQISSDGSNWRSASNGTFPVVGYGVAYARSTGQWAVIGEGLAQQSTIVVSVDNGVSWSTTRLGPFPLVNGKYIGYSIAYNNSNRWLTAGVADDVFGSMISLEANNAAGILQSTNSFTLALDFTNNIYNYRTWGTFDPGFIYNTVFTAECYGLAYSTNPNLWVAAGYGFNFETGLMYSPNAEIWYNCDTSAFINIVYSVATNNNGLWVAAGPANASAQTLQWSSNGSTWNAITRGGFAGLVGYSVSYNNGVWLATGRVTTERSTIQYSTDGSNWFAVNSGGFSNEVTAGRYQGNSAAFGQLRTEYSIYVAVGSPEATNGILYSINGIDWQNSITTPATFNGKSLGILYTSPGYWLVGCEDDTNPQNSILYSKDGSNWLSVKSIQDFNNISSVKGFAYNGSNQYVAAVNGGRLYNDPTLSLMRSIDGQYWLKCQSGGFENSLNQNYGNNVIYNMRNSLWLAVGQHIHSTGTIQYSKDTLTWRSSISAGFDVLGASGGIGNSIASDGIDTYVAVGYSTSNRGTLLYSKDGSNWLAANSGGFGDGSSHIGTDVAFAYGLWVATGNSTNPQGTIQYSKDGLNWFNAVSGGFDSNSIQYIGNGVTYDYNLSRWVAVGVSQYRNSTILYSSDGSNWVAARSGGFCNVFGVGEGNKVAVGVPQNINRYEGQTFFSKANSVSWGGDKFVATGVGQNNSTCILYSRDGQNWSSMKGFGLIPNVACNASIACNAIYGENKWVAIGTAQDTTSSILTSVDGISWVTASTAQIYTSTGRGLSYRKWVAASN